MRQTANKNLVSQPLSLVKACLGAGLIFLSQSVHAIETDKVAHATVSYAVSYTVMQVTGDRWISPLLTLALGVAKEFCVDTKPDRRDMIANGVGVAASIIVIQLD